MASRGFQVGDMLEGQNALALGAALVAPLAISRFSSAQTFSGNTQVRNGALGLAAVAGLYFLATGEEIAAALAIGAGAAGLGMTLASHTEAAKNTADARAIDAGLADDPGPQV